MGVISEHYDLLDYDQFHLNVQYDCFTDYMSLMQIIMKFYPCPEPSKNHPTILEYKELKKVMKNSDFLE